MPVRLPLLALAAALLAGCADAPAADAPAASGDPVLEVATSSDDPGDLVGDWVLDERRGYDAAAVLESIRDQRMTVADDGRLVMTATMMDDGTPMEVETVMTYRVEGDEMVNMMVSSTINGHPIPVGDTPYTETARWSFEGDRLLLRKAGAEYPEDAGDLFRRVR